MKKKKRKKAEYVHNFKLPKKHCAMCGYYHMVDSGYGHCHRFPPLNMFFLVRKFFIFFKIIHKIEYTEVEWCREACGEFDKVREST